MTASQFCSSQCGQLLYGKKVQKERKFLYLSVILELPLTLWQVHRGLKQQDCTRELMYSLTEAGYWSLKVFLSHFSNMDLISPNLAKIWQRKFFIMRDHTSTGIISLNIGRNTTWKKYKAGFCCSVSINLYPEDYNIV